MIVRQPLGHPGTKKHYFEYMRAPIQMCRDNYLWLPPPVRLNSTIIKGALLARYSNYIHASSMGWGMRVGLYVCQDNFFDTFSKGWWWSSYVLKSSVILFFLQFNGESDVLPYKFDIKCFVCWQFWKNI